MDSFDQLEQLLRGDPQPGWSSRARELIGHHWRWIVAIVVGGVIAVLVFGARSNPAAISIPMASASRAGAGSTTPTGGGTGAAGQAPTSTIVQRVVHVAGAVRHPGLVRLGGTPRVADAVDAAGGLRSDADIDRLNLAAPVSDGVRVYVPVIGAPDPGPVANSTPTGSGEDGQGPAAPAQPVELNSATPDQLEALPGVGPATSAAIVQHREKNGPFVSVDDLLEVRGIGPAKLDGLRDLVTVGP